jgi:hypothetical protein
MTHFGLPRVKYLLGKLMMIADIGRIRNIPIWDFPRHLARRVHAVNKSSRTDEGMFGVIVAFCNIQISARVSNVRTHLTNH